MGKKPKLLLLGWDAADWKVINPLIDKGQMPALERIINQGSMGNIATLDPPLSPMLWTSIATGKHAYKHGVHGFLEGGLNNTRVRPVTQESIQTKTVWNILNENGLKTNVVGWWPSHPAGELNGVQVSNFHSKAPKDSTWHNWPVVNNATYPKALEEQMNALRVHPGELGIEQLSSFIPNYKNLSEKDSKLVNILFADLAECLTVHSTSTYLAEHTEWDFMAVYYNAIDHISHAFMRFHPPQLPWIDSERYELFNDVINGIYRFHDMMLERWLELVDDDCYVMVLSDHGFHSDELRKKQLPKEPAAIAREHNHLGMLAVKGPSIKQDELFFGASLLDITPTILNIFGLPVGKDMDGKVLTGLFKEDVKIEAVDSWDEKTFSHKEYQLSQFESDELVQQLVDLGYVDSTESESPAAVKKQLDENNYYLARSYIEAKKYKEARMILEKLCNDYKDNHRYWFHLARVCVELGDTEGVEKCISHLKTVVSPSLAGIRLLEGKLHFLKNEFDKALSVFKSLGNQQGQLNEYLAYQVATTLLKLQDYKEALHFYQLNLAKNPNNANAFQGIGMAKIGLASYEEAIEALIDSISIQYYNPSAHFHLGRAFRLNGDYKEAEQAFLVARHLSPRMSKARLELIDLYENYLNEKEKALALQKEFKRTSRGTVYIVSGLPRSGTSMMMQMLQAGGMEVFTDKKRLADESNPKGYLEHEAIKRLPYDNKIIQEATGKTVKVIANLLRFLPKNIDYKIIMMRRPIHEIIRSQETMLTRLKKSKAGDAFFESEEIWADSLNKALELVKESSNMEMLEVYYGDVLNKPNDEIARITTFLEVALDEERMQQKIDKSLYRNK